MYDIIIIGAGMAGLTSAIYARRANKKVLILDKNGYGGQILESLQVDNYPGFSGISGYDLMTNVYNQVKNLGAEIEFEEVIDIDKNKCVVTKKNKYFAKSIIIATGVISRKLGIDNEDKFKGRGISYCATCDGMFFKEKKVAVVGGGNTALEDALYLSDICEKIYLIHRRDNFRGDNSTIDKMLDKNNIEIKYNCNITNINGNDKLESIVLNNDEKIYIDGLFIAIGKSSINADFLNIIERNDKGFIKVNNYMTNIDGIFAVGDCIEKSLRQLVTAASDGAIATTEAIKYINKNT